MILVNSGGENALCEWQAHFRAILPSLEVAYLDDRNVDCNQVRYVFVYNPTPGRLAQFPNLNLIISAGAGVDHIIIDKECPSHLPIVRMGSAETAQRMAEYVSLSALGILRGMRRISIAQQERRWDHFDSARSANDTKVGVMGLGNMGMPSAQMLKEIGFLVSGWSRTPKSVDGIKCYSGDVQLKEFLSSIDILVCLLPGTRDTENILNAETISLLPRGASIVNAARGNCINTADLVASLDCDHISEAILDVFNNEPLPSNHALWQHPKVTITPHIAAQSTRLDRTKYVADVIQRFEHGQPLPNLFNSVAGY